MNKFVLLAAVISSIIAVLYLIADILPPFIIAFIFSYLLQPLIEANAKRFKLHRSIVSFIVFVIFLSSLVIITLLLTPTIYKQMTIFIGEIPQYKTNFDNKFIEWSAQFQKIDPEYASKITEFGQTMINNAFAVLSTVTNSIWHYTIATINFLLIIALVPIILYYFLRDWPKIVHSMELILPASGRGKAHEILMSINELFAAYVRGQLNICIILSIYYVIILYFIGLDLALLLGILSGFFIIMPFIGPVISYFLVMINCYLSFGPEIELIYVTLFFIFGHTVEGYILSPKIIGNRIGLHPLWIIFAVFTAGNLFGFLGILFAIPLAGVAKVCINQIIDYYKSSNVYNN